MKKKSLLPDSRQTTEETRRIDSLQTLRSLAFFGIFTSHCNLSNWGAWGVSVFLVLSGFLMTLSSDNSKLDVSARSSLRFAIGKVRKLYPLHIITMLMAIVLEFLRSAHSSQKALLVRIGLNALLLQAWVPNSGIYFSLNSVSWYLSVCLFIYFLFPFVRKQLGRISAPGWIAAVGAITYMVQFTLSAAVGRVNISSSIVDDNFAKWLTYICPLFRAGDFVIGCCLGYWYSKNQKKNAGAVMATLLEAVAIILAVISNSVFVNRAGIFGRECFRYTVLYTPVSVLFVLLFAYNRGYVSKALTCKLTVTLGDISGPAFLLHHITIRYISTGMERVCDVTPGPWMMAEAAIAVTLLLAETWRKFSRSWQ